MSSKVAVILYKSKLLSNGEHPLMLRVTHKGQRKYVSLGLSCPASLWDDKKNLPKRTHPNKDFIKEAIQRKIFSYQHMLLEHPHLGSSTAKLIQTVENTRISTQFFSFFDELIDRLVKSGKIGNAHTYKIARSALAKFTNNPNLLFTDIDQRFLNKYETYLRSRGLIDNTLFTYFKTVRTVLNKAIQEGLIKVENYPFKVFKLSKFNTTTQKRAISKEDIKKIENLSIAPESPLYASQQYFIFSYYGQGMNFRDMAFLKWGDLVEDRVFYQRAKTGKRIQFKLLPPAQAIVDYHRPQSSYNGEDYVFPILNKSVHITPILMDNRLNKILGKVNKRLKELASMAEIRVNLTMYVARHTYATVLKRSDVPIPVISEAMGHSNTDITQIYLKSFADEVIDAANEHLL